MGLLSKEKTDLKIFFEHPFEFIIVREKNLAVTNCYLF